MAPPASSDLPLSQRLTKLAQTLQFGWFVGHLTLLICVLRYGLSYITFNYYSRWARYSYRLAFTAAAATYGIVVYKAFRARARAGNKQHGGALAILGDENVQYLIMAIVWIFSKQMPLALLPFSVYSIFHVATYSRTNLIPTIQPPKQGDTPTSPSGRPPYKGSPLGDAIGRFVKEYYDTSMMLVAVLEISLWFRIVLSAITFTQGSWILLCVYTVFFRARYAQSSFVQSALHQYAARGDALVSNQSTPPAVRQVWERLKELVRWAADVTDLSRYVGASGPPKKAQ